MRLVNACYCYTYRRLSVLCVSVCLSVCPCVWMLVTTVRTEKKTAEAIENHALVDDARRCQLANTTERSLLGGGGVCRQHYISNLLRLLHACE